MTQANTPGEPRQTLFPRLAAERDLSNQLGEALRQLCDKLDAIEKDSLGSFQIAAIHGVPYSGPNWSEDYNAAKAALAAWDASKSESRNG